MKNQVRGKEFKNNITSPIVDILHSQLPEFYTLSVTGGRYQRYYTPHFGTRVNNITSYIGDTATLYCSIINLGTKTVVWRKTSSRHPITVGTFTFISDKSYSIQRQIEKNEWNLVIKNVQPKHAGLYECHISSKEKQKFNVYLNVIGRKGGGGGGSDGDIYLTGTSFVTVGDHIILVCNVVGGDYIPEDVDWFKDGNEIKYDSTQRVHVTRQRSVNTKFLSSQLLIKKSNMDDAGNYVCRSGMDVTSLNVEVLNATTNNIRRGPRNEKNHQKTSSSERSTTISRKWWIVFGFMSLLYQNGVTFLEP
ncbi:uncharacterized protein LOC106868246 [Octopus bimaculoides]|uniref:uncharacterized protein LOC106868246 n=1 Tax=Octopus bimaculoides TaxID=37653 RepID=UPI0022E2CFF9|nr:uncharacterized protein LOC106868246 [Octopus bimaculoides]